MKLFYRLNNWVTSRNNALSAWSSILTIVSFPLVLLGLFLGYHQLQDIVVSPDPELEFVHPATVAYKVVNKSRKTAEDVLVSFGIFDLDSQLQGSLPIPSVNYDYVNGQSEKGPFTFFVNFGVPGHRYFGIVYVGCRGGEKLRTYWIYAKHGDKNETFYAERNKDDTFQINVSQIARDTKGYLDTLIPLEGRTAIRE